MENITIGQIIQVIGSITAIAVFFIAIYKWYKKAITDEFTQINYEINKLKNEMEDSKQERTVLLQGLLACLKGLQEQGCNGAVKKGIEDIEEYLIKKIH